MSIYKILLIKNRFIKPKSNSDPVPGHDEEKIEEEEYTDEILWDRRKRIDTVFSSGNSTKNKDEEAG